MPRRITLVVAGLGAALVAGTTGSSAGARPAVPTMAAARLAEPAARCPQGYRRHTITAKCVRIQPRFPLLSWF